MNLYESIRNSLKESDSSVSADLKDMTYEELKDYLTNIINDRESYPEDSTDERALYLDELYWDTANAIEYMNYVKEWFDERDFNLKDELSYWSEKSSAYNELEYSLNDFEKLFNGLYEENGINGELFVSYDEWLNNERQEELNEAEIITMDNDPAWKAAVEKVQKEYGLDKEMAKPYFNEKRDFLYAMYDKIKAGWDAIDWHSPMYFEMDMNVNALELIIMVEGDWKHDHAAIDSIADRTTQPVAKYEEVTEEDGSDWYSADHYFKYSQKQFKDWLNNEKPVKESEEVIEIPTDVKTNYKPGRYHYPLCRGNERPGWEIKLPKDFRETPDEMFKSFVNQGYKRIAFYETPTAVKGYHNLMAYVKESEEPNSDREQKIKNVYLMDRIIRSMNNEEALYDSGWLYNVADEDSDGGFENFKELSLKFDSNDDYYYTDEEEYNHLVDLFKKIINEYGSDGFMTKEYYQKHEGNWKELAGLDDEQLAYLKTFISDPVLINEGEKMESLKEAGTIIKISEHFKNMANELESIAEMYDEMKDDNSDDVFAGTEDEYASEMLDQHIGDILLNDPVFNKIRSTDNEYYEDLITNVATEIGHQIETGGGITYIWLMQLLNSYGLFDKLGLRAHTKELEKESVTMKESGSWRWKDDIEDIEPTEENDDIWYAVAENMVENGDYKGYDVYEVMSNIINLFKISKDSMLYDYLLKWYGSEDKLRKNVRDIYETDDAIYFVTGSGYSLYDDDLLGGNGDGLTEKEFDKFIEEN